MKKIAIHGVSYANSEELRDLSSQFPQAEPGCINVGVLHTNVGGNSDIHKNYAPSTIDSLSQHGYDYFALGHVHKRAILSESPHIAYSGNSQGLSAKPSEQEPKGCVIVEIDEANGNVTSQFHSTDSVRYVTCDIDASDFLETDDAVIFTAEEIAKICEDPGIFYLVRCTISLFSNADVDSICEAINDSRTNFFVTSLKANNSFKSFEELVNEDPFYAAIHAELQKATEPTLEELYENRANTIERVLEEFGILQQSQDDLAVQEEASAIILKTASDLEHEMSQK